jgi:hypothetical protein
MAKLSFYDRVQYHRCLSRPWKRDHHLFVR